MNDLLRRLDPRLHLAAAVGWAVFTVVTLAALAAAWAAAREAEDRVRADAQALLAEYATQQRDAMSLNIEGRRALLQATAAQLAALRDPSPPVSLRVLEAAQLQVPEFVWMGVTDRAGRLEAVSGEQPFAAEITSQARWWLPARAQRKAVVDDSRAYPGQGGERVVQMAVPIEGGRVLAATLPWSWVEAQMAKMQQALSYRRPVELMVAGRDGTLLFAPEPWLGWRIGDGTDLTEAGLYEVVRRTELRMAEGVGLGWTGVVRQAEALTLAPARTAARAVFTIVFAAGLLAAALAVVITRTLLRRLTALAGQAEAVRSAGEGRIAPPGGRDEVARIGATLASLVGQLQADKQALQRLNAELDHRVAERTQRIEQLAGESRQAAVTRERLRLARDLHDTLAHSLMSLLTQVRLVRKLRQRMADDELDAELARAEAAAADGLREAREAIGQMRHHGVREAGLGTALADLARRFEQRSGLPVALQVAPGAAAWADERAETLFRIAEEGLRNVERHANARQVSLTLEGGDAQSLVLCLSDDGVGFDPERPAPGHFGLRGMRELAALLGAQLEIDSRAGAGTTLTLRGGPPPS